MLYKGSYCMKNIILESNIYSDRDVSLSSLHRYFNQHCHNIIAQRHRYESQVYHLCCITGGSYNFFHAISGNSFYRGLTEKKKNEVIAYVLERNYNVYLLESHDEYYQFLLRFFIKALYK